MINVVFIDENQVKHETQATPGSNLMELATENLIPGIDAECGGAGSCGTCHVYINQPDYLDKLEAINEVENMLLDCLDTTTASSRLACQINLTDAQDGMTVHVAPQSL